ncbi:SGNH/GDSL hydrolase family protein [Blastococcus sp. SYSU D01042]
MKRSLSRAITAAEEGRAATLSVRASTLTTLFGSPIPVTEPTRSLSEPAPRLGLATTLVGMRGWELDRPPRWGVVALFVLVLVNAAVIAGLTLSPDPADPYGESRISDASGAASTREAPSTPPDAPVEAPGPAAERSGVPVLAVYGDGYAAGNDSGGLGVAGWPALVAERAEVQLQLHAVSQAGYASVGSSGQDFRGLVEAGPVPEAAVTVIFGSRNDVDEDVASVAANAADVISIIEAGSPQTELVVIGPAWDDAEVPAALLAVRDAVRAAAQAADVAFIDPLADGWFADGAGLIAADGISPNDRGHAYLADRIAPAVRAALTRAADPAA